MKPGATVGKPGRGRKPEAVTSVPNWLGFDLGKLRKDSERAVRKYAALRSQPSGNAGKAR